MIYFLNIHAIQLFINKKKFEIWSYWERLDNKYIGICLFIAHRQPIRNTAKNYSMHYSSPNQTDLNKDYLPNSFLFLNQNNETENGNKWEYPLNTKQLTLALTAAADSADAAAVAIFPLGFQATTSVLPVSVFFSSSDPSVFASSSFFFSWSPSSVLVWKLTQKMKLAD